MLVVDEALICLTVDETDITPHGRSIVSLLIENATYFHISSRMTNKRRCLIFFLAHEASDIPSYVQGRIPLLGMRHQIRVARR